MNSKFIIFTLIATLSGKSLDIKGLTSTLDQLKVSPQHGIPLRIPIPLGSRGSQAVSTGQPRVSGEKSIQTSDTTNIKEKSEASNIQSNQISLAEGQVLQDQIPKEQTFTQTTNVNINSPNFQNKAQLGVSRSSIQLRDSETDAELRQNEFARLMNFGTQANPVFQRRDGPDIPFNDNDGIDRSSILQASTRNPRNSFSQASPQSNFVDSRLASDFNSNNRQTLSSAPQYLPSPPYNNPSVPIPYNNIPPYNPYNNQNYPNSQPSINNQIPPQQTVPSPTSSLTFYNPYYGQIYPNIQQPQISYYNPTTSYYNTYNGQVYGNNPQSPVYTNNPNTGMPYLPGNNYNPNVPAYQNPYMPYKNYNSYNNMNPIYPPVPIQPTPIPITTVFPMPTIMVTPVPVITQPNPDQPIATTMPVSSLQSLGNANEDPTGKKDLTKLADTVLVKSATNSVLESIRLVALNVANTIVPK